MGWMRWIPVLLGLAMPPCVAVAWATDAAAACRPLPTEPPRDYLAALEKRLRPTGVTEIDRVGSTPQGRDQYVMLGSDLSLFLTVSDGQIVETGLVGSVPLEDADARRLLLIVAYTLARYSANPEAAVFDKVNADAATHLSPGAWVERFGAATAVFTRSTDGLVVKFGNAACT